MVTVRYPVKSRLKQFTVGALQVGGLASLPLAGIANSVYAYEDHQDAPPAVATAMTLRASRYLQNVASLSPMPAGSNPERAQAWPRPAEFWFKFGRNAAPRIIQRSLTPQVYTYPYADEYHGAGWEVKYNDNVLLIVNPSSLNVSGFIDGALIETLSASPDAANQKMLDEGQAVNRASLYLSAAGYSLTDLSVIQTTFTDAERSFIKNMAQWNVYCARVYKGVPFHEQGLFVGMDAAYGRIFTLGGNGMALPVPQSVDVRLSAQTAIDSALKLAQSRSILVANYPIVQMKIVQPITYWIDGRPAVVPNSGTKLVWAVRLTVDKGAPGTKFADVWVDAGTGEIVGGEQWGLGGKGAPPQEAQILSTLGTAQSIEVRQLVDSSTPLRVLSAKGSPMHFYGAISSCSRQQLDKAVKCVPTQRLIVTGEDGKQAEFNFDEKNGLIGDNSGHAVLAGQPLRKMLIPDSKLLGLSIARKQ